MLPVTKDKQRLSFMLSIPDYAPTHKYELKANTKEKLIRACRSLHTFAGLAFGIENQACSNKKALGNFYHDYLFEHIQADGQNAQAQLNYADTENSQSFESFEYEAQMNELAHQEALDCFDEPDDMESLFGNYPEIAEDVLEQDGDKFFNFDDSFYEAAAGSSYDFTDLSPSNSKSYEDYAKSTKDESEDDDSCLFFVNKSSYRNLNEKQQNLFIDCFLKSSIITLDTMSNEIQDSEAPKSSKETLSYAKTLDKAKKQLDFIPLAFSILKDEKDRTRAKKCGQLLLKDLSEALYHIIKCKDPRSSKVTVQACNKLTPTMNFTVTDEVDLINIFEEVPHLKEHFKINLISDRVNKDTLSKLHDDNEKIHDILLSVKNIYFKNNYHQTLKTHAVFDCCQMCFDKQLNHILSIVLGMMFNTLLTGTLSLRLKLLKKSLKRKKNRSLKNKSANYYDLFNDDCVPNPSTIQQIKRNYHFGQSHVYCSLN